MTEFIEGYENGRRAFPTKTRMDWDAPTDYGRGYRAGYESMVLDGIAQVMDRNEWNADTLDFIARLVRLTDRKIRDV